MRYLDDVEECFEAEMKPEISVVIPTYNRASLVRATIESVLEQTLTNYEIVVVDDGSTDNTSQILQDFIEGGRIKYIYQENSGRSEARNNGLANSSGDYLMFLDSDDLLYPNSFELLLNAAKKYPDAGFLSGWRTFIDDRGNRIEADDGGAARLYGEKINIHQVQEIHFLPSSCIVKREIAKAVNGYDKGMELAEDLDFFIKVCDLTTIATLSEPVVRIRRHNGNTSHTTSHTPILEASIRICKKNLARLESEPRPDEIGMLGRLKGAWLIRLGDSSYELGQNKVALKYYCRSVAALPGNLIDPHVRRQLAASAIPGSIKALLKKFFGREQ